MPTLLPPSIVIASKPRLLLLMLNFPLDVNPAPIFHSRTLTSLRPIVGEVPPVPVPSIRNLLSGPNVPMPTLPVPPLPGQQMLAPHVAHWPHSGPGRYTAHAATTAANARERFITRERTRVEIRSVIV